MPNSVFTCILFCALQFKFSKTVAPYSAPTALLDAIQVLTRIILDTYTVFSLPALYNPIPPPFHKQNRVNEFYDSYYSPVMLRL